MVGLMPRTSNRRDSTALDESIWRSFTKARMISMFTCTARLLFQNARQHEDSVFGKGHRRITKSNAVRVGGHKL
jgi:hypothetical protein